MDPVPLVRPPRRRRWFLKAVLLLLALLGIVWLARGPLFGPLVARTIAEVLTRESGGHAAVAHASGGWLGDAQLSGVAVSGPVSGQPAKPWWTVSAQQVAVDYDFGLLRGELSAVRGVTVDGLLVVIDDDLRPASATASAPASWPPLFARLPSNLPNLSVGGEVTVRSGGHQVQIGGLRLSGVDQRLELTVQRLAVDDRELALPAIVLERSAPDTLALAEPLVLAVPELLAVPLHCDHLELTLGETRQQAVADGRLAGGTWHATASATSVAVTVQGVDLVALGLLPAEAGRLLVDADLEFHDGRWDVRSLHAAGAGMVCDAHATVVPDPWRCTALDAAVTVDLAALKASLPALPGVKGTLHATLTGELPLSRTQWSQGQVALSVLGSDVVYDGRPCTPLSLGLTLAQGDVRLAAVDAGWGTLRAQLASVETTQNDAPAPAVAGGWRLIPRPITVAGGVITLAARGGGSGAGRELDGELRLNSLPLAELIGFSGLRHLQGTASGTMHLGGTLAAPEWTGALTVDGIEAKLSPDIPTFTAGSAQCTLAARVLTLVNLQGDLGGAVLNAQGRILLDGGDDALKLTCHGRNLLLVQRHDARIRADLDLRLNGPFNAPVLAGDVVVTSARLTPELHLSGGLGGDTPAPLDLGDGRVVLFELPDPPLSTLHFNLHITTVPAPSGPSTTAADSDSGLRVVTRWGRGTCDLDLHLGGTGAAPEPEGRVSVRDGVATLPFSTLTITHGELLFPPGDPFQPRLTATAAARIRRYDVQVQVTGTLHAPQVRASGSGLDEQEALLLLTTGSTPRELQDEKGQLAAIGRVGTWLGQETWRSIEGPDDPEAGPSLTDRVTVEWGRETSTMGRDTIDAEVELTPPGSRPAFLLTGERDRYEQYNAGITLRLYWGGEEP